MKTLVSKMVTIQSTLKAPKGQYNSFAKYKYRSCEDIVEAVKPLLAAQGLFMMISDKVVFHSDLRCYVEATVTVMDGENSIVATASAREAAVKKGMDDSQITGATSSYARKYALNGMFGIDDTKDSDATNDHKPSEDYQWGQLLVSHMSKGDSTALLDEWSSKDAEFQEMTWRHLSSQDRSKIKKMLADERKG